MPRSILVVGSGPAAAGAALACAQDPTVSITVLDVGATLEPDHETARARLEASDQDSWDPRDLELVGRGAQATTWRALPEKRSYGSDFPFRDFGQRRLVTAAAGVTDAVISGAYGGFSSVWGAQVMPFTAASFRDWPVAATELESHYRAVLSSIPFAAEHDDLEQLFPLHAPAAPLPTLSERTQAVLARYERHRAALNRRGVIVGRARLAFAAGECVLCGLCMAGCPYRLIYSAAQTIEELRASGRVQHVDGHLAVRLEEDDGGATVAALELASGRVQRFAADRVLVACGGIGTSRLVMASLGLFDTDVPVLESRQFSLPFVSLRPTAHDPRGVSAFTLNQFNAVVQLDESAYDVSQLHFYTYNPAFLEALPPPLQARRAEWARRELLRRVCLALGYLPSWASPSFFLRVRPAPGADGLPAVALHRDSGSVLANGMFRTVLGRLLASARLLDLWPLVPLLRVSQAGRSYHWGGTFPHAASPASRFSTDALGRVAPWRRIHLVDASVFPSIPATTFTLSVMANAHRIGQAVLRDPA